MSTDQYTTLPFSSLLRGADADFRLVRETSGLKKADIKELADDIEAKGMLYPLVVWPSPDHEGKFVIVGGNRRFAALQMLWAANKMEAMISAIPVHIVPGTKLDARVVAVTDNMKRADLSGYEIAREIVDLRLAGMSGNEIAKKFGKSGAWVSVKTTTYEKTCEPVHKAWKSGQITSEIAEDLAKLEEDKQEEALEEILEARGGGTKEEKGKSRKKSKKAKGDDKLQKASAKEVKFVRGQVEGATDAFAYAQGMFDALSFVVGEICIGDFGKGYVAWLKESTRLEKLAIAEAKEAARKAKDVEEDDQEDEAA